MEGKERMGWEVDGTEAKGTKSARRGYTQIQHVDLPTDMQHRDLVKSIAQSLISQHTYTHTYRGIHLPISGSAYQKQYFPIVCMYHITFRVNASRRILVFEYDA